tara:strand:- start:320 stop:2296 length:1977 start_codon:yes stop_codon:yes gene_type:complete
MDYVQIYEYEFGVKFTKRSGVNWQGHCPLPNHDDSNASFSFHIETGQCQCFGCGFKGNAITMAKALNHDNPYKFIENNENGHIRRDRPLKSENRKPTMTIDEVEKKKEMFFDNLNDNVKAISRKWECDFGITDDGRHTYHYANAIKVHKCKKTSKQPYWIGIDKHCQIFGLTRVDLTKPVIIFEGEKDVVNMDGVINAITFSHGAGTIPKDLSILKDVPEIIVLGDNDDAGRKHNEVVAHQFYLMGIPVKIGVWDKNLPIGFDPSDDAKVNKSIIETSKAIGNAVSYVPPSQPIETKSDNQKGTYPIMEISNYYDKHKDKKVEVICDNLIFNQGTTLIAGSDNTGKTWVAFHLAFSIALGKPFLGWETQKKPVLMVQFELRPHMIKERLDNLFKVYGTDVPNFKIASMSDDDLIFTDAWDKIFNTLKNEDFKDGVVIIDNLYTSTDKDISDNQAMKPVLQMIRYVAKERNLAIVLIAHHNKPTGKDITTEPILAKPLIAGGKQLTNFVDNCLQLGISTFKDNLTRGKITKINTKQCNIYMTPFKIWWDEETCLLEYGGIIPNEKLHCEANKTRWEYTTIVEMSAYSETAWKSPRFDRAMLSEFLKDKTEFDRTLHTPDYIKNKTTRFINKVCDWGFVKKTGHNQYELINEVIAELDNA